MANIVTPEFRVSYPNVFKPRPNKLKNNELEYSLELLFPKGADLSRLKAEAQRVALEKWGERAKTMQLRMPFRDQADKADKETGILGAPYEAGAVYMKVATKQKPAVVDAQVQPIIEESAFYAGCWAVASIRAYAYEKGGNVGVSFGLGNVQKVKDGEPLGSRTSPQQDFAPIAGTTTGTAPVTAGSLFA